MLKKQLYYLGQSGNRFIPITNLTNVDKIPTPKQGLNHAPYTSLAKLKITSELLLR